MELYFDSSVDGSTKNGVGVFRVFDQKSNLVLDGTVELKRTSSTIAEYETFLHAANEIRAPIQVITMYTDCESLVNLLTGKRKSDLTKHRLYEILYKKVLAAYDRLGNPRIEWIKGHDTSINRANSIHKTRFAEIDQHARAILRKSAN
jgi:ribonuclease HI